MKPLKLMILDDDPVTVKLAEGILKELKSLEIVTATDPLEALEIMKKEKLHIILSDISMPEMDGFKFLKEAKNLDPLVHVIMMTAYSTLSKIILFLGEGAMDFVLKPFKDPEDLKLVIQSSMDRWRRWLSALKSTAGK